jgi:hypothetical protein
LILTLIKKRFLVCGVVIEQEYNPETVYIFHDLFRQQGTALLAFKNDMQGLEDAEAFQRSFAECGRGRKQWLNGDRPANLDLYGWQATEKVDVFSA